MGLVPTVQKELLSYWKMNRCPSVNSRALWSMYSLRIALHIAAVILPYMCTSRPVPATESCHHHCHHHSRDGVSQVMSSASFSQTWHLAFRPKSSFLVSSDKKILFLQVWESLEGFLANSKRAATCLSVRSGFQLAIMVWLIECVSNGWPLVNYLHKGTMELHLSDHWVLGHLSD